jgi:hypothetical protein
MKTLCALILLISFNAFSADVSLLVTCENRYSAEAGSTYRLYAVIPDDATVHVVYGDVQNPLSISASNGFYQHPLGGNTSADIHPSLASSYPDLNFDSWITIGYENQSQNNLWDVGLDLISFSQGGNISCDNGGWFLVPGDERSSPNDQGLVLLAQFTTTGTVSGVLNLQGKDAGGVWNSKGLLFSSEDCLVPGCTNPEFSNFNPLAQVNDGSCHGSCLPTLDAIHGTDKDWTVFPNPLRQNMMHLQFNGFQFPAFGQGLLEVRDASGKCVISRNLSSHNIQAENRMSIELDLAAGTYDVIIYQGDFRESKKLVIQK